MTVQEAAERICKVSGVEFETLHPISRRIALSKAGQLLARGADMDTLELKDWNGVRMLHAKIPFEMAAGL